MVEFSAEQYHQSYSLCRLPLVSEVHTMSCVNIESSHLASSMRQEPSLDSSVGLRVRPGKSDIGSPDLAVGPGLQVAPEVT